MSSDQSASRPATMKTVPETDNASPAKGLEIFQLDIDEAHLLLAQYAEDLQRLAGENEELKARNAQFAQRDSVHATSHDAEAEAHAKSNLEDECELLRLQVLQLQEELTNAFGELRDLKKKNENPHAIVLPFNDINGLQKVSGSAVKKEEGKRGLAATSRWVVKTGTFGEKRASTEEIVEIEAENVNVKLRLYRSGGEGSNAQEVHVDLSNLANQSDQWTTTQFARLTQVLKALESEAKGKWKKIIEKLSESVHSIVPVLRFDHVEIRSEREIPGYENIWISLKNASYEEKLWKSYDFRVAAADVLKDGFTTNPRYEFPEVNGERPQFEKWFAESQDGSGSKLEIRFELVAKAMDMDVWNRLSVQDRAVFVSLLSITPSILHRLEGAKTARMRPMKQWIELVEQMQNVALERLPLHADTFAK